MKTNKSDIILFSFTGFIVLLFLISTQLSFAGPDTTKVAHQQFPLNDPRNPNCPCHKLQKQAEEEFAQQNKNQDSFENKNVNANKPEPTSEIKEKSLRISSATSVVKYKRKKKTVWFTKTKFKTSKRFHRIKRTIPKYEICFKW